ncbi:EamA family transporter [Deinococcus murrayi]|uniref:EamA family transporter n=1 Tax=Deinococcus murrayi TaxID=68910 RepID=UPI000481BC3F|nr:EamA family transporter [Deinococcus murrayi]
MPQWIVFALISMFFAGFTSVIAKVGLDGISGELGLTVRTLFVFVLVVLFAFSIVPAAEWRLLTQKNWLWLGLSGVTTSLSWIFYYKALKVGDVATVALIDKGSVVVAMALAALLLREHITPRMLLGASLIVGGLLVIARK